MQVYYKTVLETESEMKDKANLDGLKAFEHKQPWLLLYFNTSWCAPCKNMALIIDEISSQYSEHLAMINIDVDEQMSLAKQFEVRGVPTLVLLDKLQNTSSLVGGVTKVQVEGWLNKELGSVPKNQKSLS